MVRGAAIMSLDPSGQFSGPVLHPCQDDYRFQNDGFAACSLTRLSRGLSFSFLIRSRSKLLRIQAAGLIFGDAFHRSNEEHDIFLCF